MEGPSGRASSSPQYSGLSQINKTNVDRLEQAWFYPAGDNGFRFGANPIVIDGVMYLVGAHNAIVALDASNGKISGNTPLAMFRA